MSDSRGRNRSRDSTPAHNFRGAKLKESNFAEENLIEAIFDAADLSHANLTRAKLKGARFDGAVLFDATLEGADLTGARLRSADLQGARMRGAVLRAADLAYASLEGVDLREADLSAASLAGADLRGTVLDDANLMMADLRGARYGRHTRWPAGWDVGATGAVLSHEGEPRVHLTGLRPGRPYPLGATWDGQGVNFALFAEHATHVEVCFFDTKEAHRASTKIRLPEQTDGIWHVYVPHIVPGQLYAYRVYGPYKPENGFHFNPNKLALDPYAKAVTGTVTWHDALFGYRVGSKKQDLGIDVRNSARYMPKCVVVDTAFPWGEDRHPRTPWHNTVLYELHIKGFTKLHPALPADMRGTYSALGSPEAIQYLKSLGVTAVELLPVHQHVDERETEENGLSNYWGYNTLCYFAPNTRYSRYSTPGSEVREFKAMVKALHAAGIEVILDVVYNHTAEGNHLGPTLSFKAIDNSGYYRLVSDQPRYYMDYTGCGNTLNVLNGRTLQLLMDSLRYWVEEMHVDGFRFDLAAALMRGLHEAAGLSAFFDVITQDPVISQVKLIAEPWDVGPGGYQVGSFPPLWSEWNGKYRDTVRRFWKGDDSQAGELAYRLSGSSDLYEHNGRRPYASINFVAAHDGFTLRDLVSYNNKHNEANRHNNEDGDDNNNSWNCGVEGPTDDPGVQQLRRRQIRNFLATLWLSQGVPMISAGDERGRTQRGNNNAYCQDNEISWLDWSLNEEDSELLAFTKQLSRLRREHPVLRRRRFFFGRAVHGREIRDIVWLRPDGAEMDDAEWNAGFVRCLGMLLNGQAMREWTEEGDIVYDDILLCLLNAHHEELPFKVPHFGAARNWELVLDTCCPEIQKPRSVASDETYPLSGRSLALLKTR